MTKRKKARVKRKSGLTDTDENAKTMATEQWLRMVDKPQGRRAKRRGKR